MLPLRTAALSLCLLAGAASSAHALEQREIEAQTAVTRPQVVVVPIPAAQGFRANRHVTYTGIMSPQLAGCIGQPDHSCLDATVELELILDLARATPGGPRRWTDKVPAGVPTTQIMVFRRGAAMVALADVESTLPPGPFTPNWSVDDAWVDIETRLEPDTGQETKRLLLHAIVTVRGAGNHIDKLSYSATISATALGGVIPPP